KSGIAAASAAVLIRGTVSARLSVNGVEQCRALGFPITSFATNAFGPEALVSEDATAMSDTECLHEQVMEASADVWAKVAYEVLCGGGGEARFCGAVATRECSIGQLMVWGEPRSGAVSTPGRAWGFEYVLPPQDEAARTALYGRAQQEVQTLMAEAAEVTSEDAAGTRACPNERLEDNVTAQAQAAKMNEQLDQILRGASAGSP
ncbi:MAG: hypothetical protein ACHQ53_15210, partial [Polyangiales bacterium]